MNFRRRRRDVVLIVFALAATLCGFPRPVFAQGATGGASGGPPGGPAAASAPASSNRPAGAPATAPGPGTAGPATGGPPPVPVSVAAVSRKDVPIVLRGLGTVLALQSVQLRSRVDGTLMKVPVTEGQEVREGDLLAIIDPRPYQAILDAVLAKKRQDEAQLAAAKADLARYSMLAAREVASQQKLETTTALVGQITATIAADDAQIDAAKLNLAFCYITAPFDGRVGLRITDPGSFVRAAEVTAVMPISQLRPIAVTFTVPQDNLPAIQRAMAAGKPSVVAFSSDDRAELDRGTLLTIDNTIDSTTGTIKLKATFPNQNYRLWPGQFVNTRIVVGTSAAVVTVPSTAVRHGQDGLFVFLLKPDQTVGRQAVEIERDDGAVAIVAKGLEDGQQVVIEGHSRLQNGSRVVLINAAPKPAAAAPKVGG